MSALSLVMTLHFAIRWAVRQANGDVETRGMNKCTGVNHDSPGSTSCWVLNHCLGVCLMMAIPNMLKPLVRLAPRWETRHDGAVSVGLAGAVGYPVFLGLALAA